MSSEIHLKVVPNILPNIAPNILHNPGPNLIPDPMPNILTGFQQSRDKIPEQIYAQLKAFGEPEETAPWLDYSGFELGEVSAQVLIKIIEFEYDVSEVDDEVWWLALHAWRILISKKYEAAIPALIGCLTADPDDDWASEDIARGLIEFGPISIRPIFLEFAEEANFAESVYGLATLTEVLAAIAKAHVAEYELVAGFLREQLASFETLPPNLNSFLICALLEIQDLKALPIIERVFARKYLELEIVDWKLVRSKFPEANLPEKIKEEKLEDGAPKYSGDIQFQKLLKAIGGSINIDEVKCRILGLLLAIEYIEPFELADQIIREANEEECGFQTQGQAEYYYREFFGLWNEMTIYQNELFQLPKVDLNKAEISSDTMLSSLRIFWLSVQIEAFLDGFNMGNDNTQIFQNSLAFDFIDFLDQKIFEIEDLEESDILNSQLVSDLISETENHWNENYLAFAKECLKLREQKSARVEFIQANKEVGRNDPCPCGSGNKFKKCCLVV